MGQASSASALGNEVVLCFYVDLEVFVPTEELVLVSRGGACTAGPQRPASSRRPLATAVIRPGKGWLAVRLPTAGAAGVCVLAGWERACRLSCRQCWTSSTCHGQYTGVGLTGLASALPRQRAPPPTSLPCSYCAPTRVPSTWPRSPTRPPSTRQSFALLQAFCGLPQVIGDSLQRAAWIRHNIGVQLKFPVSLHTHGSWTCPVRSQAASIALPPLPSPFAVCGHPVPRVALPLLVRDALRRRWPRQTPLGLLGVPSWCPASAATCTRHT